MLSEAQSNPCQKAVLVRCRCPAKPPMPNEFEIAVRNLIFRIDHESRDVRPGHRTLNKFSPGQFSHFGSLFGHPESILNLQELGQIFSKAKTYDILYETLTFVNHSSFRNLSTTRDSACFIIHD